MTISQLFISGYIFVGILAFTMGRLSRADEISKKDKWIAWQSGQWLQAELKIAQLAANLSRLTNPPRDKSTGRFK